MTALAERNDATAIEQLLVQGDLKSLSPDQRVQYYNRLCDSLGLNPLTRPFEYLSLSGKLTLYAKKDATEQLRKIHGVSIIKLERDLIDGVFIVTAYARDLDGREDSATGAVPIEGLKGEPRANAIMKAETKAKRRVTLSICGLGLLDETEVESIPNARQPDVKVTQLPPSEDGEKQLAIVRAAFKAAKAEGRVTDEGYAELLADFGVKKTTELKTGQLSELAIMLEEAGRGDAWDGGRTPAMAEGR